MASSSSRSIINHNPFLKYVDEEQQGSKVSIQETEEEEGEEEGEEKELLQLKLGHGSDTRHLCRRTVGNNNDGEESNPVVPRSGSSSSIGLGLGLGLKLWPNMMMEQGSSEMVESGVEAATRRFIGRLPSSPSSSWQIMESQDYWYNKPTSTPPLSPPSSHHYYSHHSNPHHSGLWFTLHSSTNQRGEALPQVPKAYIRVKNEDTTIFMVKKYLVTKLGLFNENEVEILCSGHRLANVQSLKMVRDHIWIPALVDSLNASSSAKSLPDHSSGMMATTPNLMPLLYQKFVFSNNSSNYL